MLLVALIQVVDRLQNYVYLFEEDFGDKNELCYDFGVELSIEWRDLDVEGYVRVDLVNHVIAHQRNRRQIEHHLRVVVALKAQAVTVENTLGFRVVIGDVGLTVDVFDRVGRLQARCL